MSFFSKSGMRQVSFSYGINSLLLGWGYFLLELCDEVSDCEVQFCIPLFVLICLTVLL